MLVTADRFSLRLFCFGLILSFCAGVPANAAPVSLTSVQPASVYAYYPALNVTPKVASISVNEGQPGQGVRFTAESVVTYAIPPGESSFSGILIFEPRLYPTHDPSIQDYTDLLLRMEVDGKIVFERGFLNPTPPLQFTVPVSGGQKLTLLSMSSYPGSGGTFVLARAQFSTETQASSVAYLPSAGQGYVDCTPAPRQAIEGAYFSGEKVDVTSTFAGQAAQANVVLQLAFDGDEPLEVRLPTSLKVTNGAAQGTTSWQVPSHQGPGMLTVEEEVNGRRVSYWQRRIAVIPRVDLSKISNSTFGVHSSTPGFPFLDDEFAYLWGAKWARAYVRWPVLEQSPGHMDFSRIDAVVDLYRSQHMFVLLVLGEDFPKWAGRPGTPEFMTAWQHYVSETVKHFAGKVTYWDVFNEVDVKYDMPSFNGEPNWDLEALRTAFQTIRAVDPQARTVCCSAGTSRWLIYDKRLFDAGLLKDIDILSVHPYRPIAPEVKLGGLTYLEMVAAPAELAKLYGVSKPVWSTEETWTIGVAGDTTINAPGMPAAEQAKYFVRVNLMSQMAGVPFFLHMPYTKTLPRIYVNALAAYANMTSLMSGLSRPTILAHGPDLWGAYYEADGGYLGVLWSAAPGAVVSLSAQNLRFMDINGNPLNLNAESVNVTDSPIYFRSSSAPQYQLAQQARTIQWTEPRGFRWDCQANARCSSEGKGAIHVVGKPVVYSYNLVSSPIGVQPASCQAIRVNLALKQGFVGMFAMDTATGKKLENIYANVIPDGVTRPFEFRFQTGSASSVKLVLTNANPQPSVSEFSVSDFAVGSSCY